MSTERVQQNIKMIFERRRAALYALSLFYAAKAENYFKKEQAGGRYWSNQTNQARDRVFSGAFQIGETVTGWYLAHGVQYGIYLELANDRQNAALWPVILKFQADFYRDVKKLYGDIA